MVWVIEGQGRALCAWGLCRAERSEKRAHNALVSRDGGFAVGAGRGEKSGRDLWRDVVWAGRREVVDWEMSWQTGARGLTSRCSRPADRGFFLKSVSSLVRFGLRIVTLRQPRGGLSRSR